MSKYESVFILRPNITLLAETSFEEKATKILGSSKITKIERLGIKRLAYEIKENKKGYYIVIYFNGDFETVQELEKYCKENNNVLKFVIVKVE